MWPLGNIIGNNSNRTSLEQLFQLMIDQYGWVPDPQVARRRLMVFVLAPRNSALNKAILDTSGHWNWASKESWDLLCPGFGVENQSIGPGRLDTDILDVDLKFSEKHLYSFINELLDVVGKSRTARAELLRDISRSSEGGLLLAEARVGDKDLVIDWSTSWVIEFRKIAACEISAPQVVNIIEKSQRSNKDVSPIEKACIEISNSVNKRNTSEFLSRIDPAGAVGAVLSVIPLILS